MNARDTWIVVRNTARVLADSNRLDDIREVAEIVGRARMYQLVDVVRDTPEGRRLLRERPELNTTAVDYDGLRALPETTLGGAYAAHLARHELSPDKLNVPTPAPSDPDIVYLARRLQGIHDIWHPLLGLGVEGHEEVLVHAFTYGQLRMPVSAMIIAFGSLKHIVLERRWHALRRTLPDLYRMGRDAPLMAAVYFEDDWETPIAEVRERFRLRAAA